MCKQSAVGLQRRKQIIVPAGKNIITQYITFSLQLEKTKILRGEKIKISKGEKRRKRMLG